MKLLFVLAAWFTVALAQPTGTLIVALSSDPVSLYLPRAADRTAANAAWSLYDGLVWIDDDGELVPALAERWEVSDDGTEYTFFLRQGVRFHNGEPLTAEAVVATWEFGKDPSNDYAMLFSAAELVEALDDYTVRMVTAEPSAVFLTRLATHWGVVPPAYMREVGIEGFERNPVGTGPFRFVSRSLGDRIVLEANPDYWQAGLPKVAEVIYRVIPDASTRLAAIQTGEIHIANRLSAEQAALLERASGVEVISYLNDRVFYVGFKNIGAGVGTPLEDVRVRQALNYATNRPGIVQGIFAGAANEVAGFIVEGNLGFDPELMRPYPYDLERARALLAEAGYSEGFEIAMGCPADGYLNINEVCLAIQRSLAQIGVEVRLEFMTTNRYWSEPHYGAVGPMYVDSWSSEIGEALPRLQGALLPGNYYNTWEDAELAAMIEELARTVDREARAELYRALHRRMFDDPPFIYLYQPVIFEAVRSEVESYAPRAAEEYFLKGVSLR